MVLGIYGAGGAGREVREIAVSPKAGIRRWGKVVFIDDRVSAPDVFKGIPRMSFGRFQKAYPPRKAEIIIALGEPYFKERLYDEVQRAGYELASVISSHALISESASIGKGVIIKPGAIVSVDAIIEDNVSIEEYAVIGHDSIIHKHAQISSFVMISGHCEVGERTYVGINASVREDTKIGAHSVISMGAVVQRDIPASVTAMGNPARPMLRRNDEDRVFKERKV